MPHAPWFLFFIGRVRVEKDTGLWFAPLPTSPAGPGDGPGLAYGDYFTAAADFLTQNQDALRDRELGVHPQTVQIRLEKHGACYHPAKVRVLAPAGLPPLCLNLAFSSRACGILAREVDFLNRLGPMNHPSFLPRVLAWGHNEIRPGLEAAFFLANWFAGFHEFHASAPDPEGGRPFCIWPDGAPGPVLSKDQVRSLFFEAARILTLYYDPDSGRQIYPWHHAAGDFIARPGETGVDVRLITVRNYASMAGTTDGSPPDPVDTLLYFFLNLTLRMRLDREDGVGAFTWGPDLVLDASVDGFRAGLLQKPFPKTLARAFFHKLKHMSLPEMAEALCLLKDSWHPGAPEIPLVQDRLADHCISLFQKKNHLPD